MRMHPQPHAATRAHQLHLSSFSTVPNARAYARTFLILLTRTLILLARALVILVVARCGLAPRVIRIRHQIVVVVIVIARGGLAPRMVRVRHQIIVSQAVPIARWSVLGRTCPQRVDKAGWPKAARLQVLDLVAVKMVCKNALPATRFCCHALLRAINDQEAA